MSNPSDLLHHPATLHTALQTTRRGDSTGTFVGAAIRRRLPHHTLAERYAAVHPASGTPALLYRIEPGAIHSSTPDAARGVARLCSLEHPHLLTVRRFELDCDGSMWLLTDFPGSPSGLLSLPQLLSHKASGVLAEREAHHAALHLLSAIDSAHSAGFAHGSLRADDVIVDPRGRTLIELFGVARVLSNLASPLEAARRADVRSIASLVYELLTGVPLNGERLPMPRSLGRAGKRWDSWIARTLDGAPGFADARQALAQLP